MIDKKILKLLSIKDYSTYQLKQKLIKKNFPLQEIQKSLDKYIQQGFINDKELAKRRTNMYREKGYGPKWITQKFKQQGLSVTSYSRDEQLMAIKKLLKTSTLSQKTHLQKMNFLKRRGFHLSAIVEVLPFNEEQLA